MDTLIPIQYYISIYYNLLLLITLIVFLQSYGITLESQENLKSKKAFGFIIFIIILLYIGLRPINYRFGDMVIYNIQFKNFANGILPEYKKDVLFEFFQFNFSKIGSAGAFFFVCAVLYIYPLYAFSKKVFKDYWFYAFFMLIISFSFWAYGTNGIRNGIATSLFLYGVSRNEKWKVFAILFISLFIHKSLMLPIFAYIITLFYNKPKSFFYFWLFTIPLSLALGGFFTAFFLGLGIIEEKSVSSYLGEFDQASEGVLLKVGFRWDFLLYSASGVFAGWYYVIKKKFEDPFYFQLLNVFLLVNGFWVLVIKANYSNRFAYLSWFLLGVIIIYPLLKSKFFENQHQVIARIIIAYFAFTYFMEIILGQPT
ncbi:EpsG family protein [Flavobacterium sp.]|uniref:EpsG family protein n=1 Tax=Flavobacterium sp. TaxID=239 RepID=UPI003753811B